MQEELFEAMELPIPTLENLINSKHHGERTEVRLSGLAVVSLIVGSPFSYLTIDGIKDSFVLNATLEELVAETISLKEGRDEHSYNEEVDRRLMLLLSSIFIDLQFLSIGCLHLVADSGQLFRKLSEQLMLAPENDQLRGKFNALMEITGRTPVTADQPKSFFSPEYLELVRKLSLIVNKPGVFNAIMEVKRPLYWEGKVHFSRIARMLEGNIEAREESVSPAVKAAARVEEEECFSAMGEETFLL